MTWALEMGRSHELEAAPRLLLLCMANYADAEGHNVFPSNATLQNDTGLSESSIRRHTRRLEALGLIAPDDPAYAAIKIKRADKRPNVYRLLLNDAERHERRGVTMTPRKATGGHSDRQRGVKRGVTVTPDPLRTIHKNHAGAEAPEPAAVDNPHAEAELEASSEASPAVVQAPPSDEGAGARETSSQHLAEVVALKSAARAREAASRDPQTVAALDLGRQLRESIRARRELKTVAGAK